MVHMERWCKGENWEDDTATNGTGTKSNMGRKKPEGDKGLRVVPGQK